MKFSVIIPAYNGAKTIKETLDSVLSQTVAPYEILVFNDGSTDDTGAILKSYESRITVFSQPNGGVDSARNFLCARARGNILAFLDADDVWHPRYLEVQQQMIEAHPAAVGYFTNHEDFGGYGPLRVESRTADQPLDPEVIQPKEFLAEYNRRPLNFQISGFCIPRRMLERLGPKPFHAEGSGDTYVHTSLPLLGPIVHTGVPLVAYRVNDSSLSANQLKSALRVISTFEELQDPYKQQNDPALYRAFKVVRASRKRTCGKFLMGAGRVQEAKRLFWSAAKDTRNPASLAKSLTLLLLANLPPLIQPAWPSSKRVWKPAAAAKTPLNADQKPTRPGAS